MSIPLLGMFDPDEEQKNYTIDKKEQQKIEDEFERADKSIDTYLGKQLSMLIAGE